MEPSLTRYSRVLVDNSPNRKYVSAMSKEFTEPKSTSEARVVFDAKFARAPKTFDDSKRGKIILSPQVMRRIIENARRRREGRAALAEGVQVFSDALGSLQINPGAEIVKATRPSEKLRSYYRSISRPSDEVRRALKGDLARLGVDMNKAVAKVLNTSGTTKNEQS